MDSIEFLNFAKNLNSNQSKTEIDYRQIVSRSYYCAFHKVTEKSLLLTIPVHAYGGGTHKSLATTLIQLKPANTKLKGIGFRLNNFHLLRVKADYDLDIQVDSKLAEQAISECEKILNELNEVDKL